MAGAPLEGTRWPGIYRRGKRYVYEWTDADGKRRRRTAETASEARAEKAKAEERAKAGDRRDGPRRKVTVAAYALELFGADPARPPGAAPRRGRYQGRRGAVRDSTVASYRRHLEMYVLPALGDRPLSKLTSPDIVRFVADLAGRAGDDYLSDASIRRIVAPLTAMLAQAVEEGLASHNVARDVRLPSGRDELRRFTDVDADDEDSDDPRPGKARALTRPELANLLLVVDPRWRLLLELLAATGLRISEALALRWRDLHLDGDRPVVRVRRALVDGVIGPPKSRHSRRDVPIAHELVVALRARRAASEWPGEDHLVFPSLAGTPMDQRNLRRRTLAPAAEEAGVPWARFHSLRHTCASMLLDEGRNVVQVSRWLGHHSASFTLDVYAHLMEDGIGGPLETVGVGSGSGSGVRSSSVSLGDLAEVPINTDDPLSGPNGN